MWNRCYTINKESFFNKYAFVPLGFLPAVLRGEFRNLTLSMQFLSRAPSLDDLKKKLFFSQSVSFPVQEMFLRIT